MGNDFSFTNGPNTQPVPEEGVTFSNGVTFGREELSERTDDVLYEEWWYELLDWAHDNNNQDLIDEMESANYHNSLPLKNLPTVRVVMKDNIIWSHFDYYGLGDCVLLHVHMGVIEECDCDPNEDGWAPFR